MKSLKWFKNRIGKTIYRDTFGCECEDCKDIIKNGLVISNDFHAESIYDFQNDVMFDEKKDLNYRDKK